MQKYLYLLLLLSYSVSALNNSDTITEENNRIVEFNEFQHDGKNFCMITLGERSDIEKGGTFFSLLFNPYETSVSTVSFGLLFNNKNFMDFKKDATLVFYGNKGIQEEKLHSLTAKNMAENNDSRLRVDLNIIDKKINYREVETILNYFIDKPIQVNYGDKIYKVPNLKSKKDKKEINAFKTCMKEKFKKAHKHTGKSNTKSEIDNGNNDIKDKKIISDKIISGDKYIAKDSVFCLSERALENQSQMLAAGVMNFSPQCFSAAQDIKVVLDDFKVFSGTAKVVGVDSGKVMWTTSESLIEK